jgi:hypothetical protein
LDGSLPWEAISASTGAWLLLQIDIWKKTMTKVLYGCERLYSKFGNSHTKCGSTGMRCYMTRNLNLLERCKMQK